jgi:hypothetical protein
MNIEDKLFRQIKDDMDNAVVAGNITGHWAKYPTIRYKNNVIKVQIAWSNDEELLIYYDQVFNSFLGYKCIRIKNRKPIFGKSIYTKYNDLANRLYNHQNQPNQSGLESELSRLLDRR